MNAHIQRPSRWVSAFIFFCLWLLTSCAPTRTSTPFRPPTNSAPKEVLPTTSAVPQLFAPSATTPAPQISSSPTATSPCTNGLTFMNDATIPDDTLVAPGSSVDKQWLVTNSGTCDWDSTYRLKWIGGDPLGAVTEQALYPARAGTQAILRIIFTAPNETGTYGSTWQAFDPNGAAFGDTVYMQVVVASP